MANSIKIQVNTSFEDKLKELDEQIEDDKRQAVQDRAVTALKYSYPLLLPKVQLSLKV